MQKTKNRVVERIYPLTSMQEGILFHKMLDEQSTSYVVQEVMSVKAELDAMRISQALELLTQRHDILRTAVVYKKVAKPQQILFYKRKIECEEFDISDSLHEEKAKVIDQMKEADVKRGFDLEKDSLLRLKVIKCGPADYKIIWSFHHIIMDGWCLSIICTDFMNNYLALKEGSSFESLSATVREERARSATYEDYIKWIRLQDKEEGMGYWKTLLTDYSTISEIAPRGPEINAAGAVQSLKVELTKELSNAIIDLSSQYHITANTFFEMVWGTLLQRYSNSKDVVFGKVVSGRNAQLKGIEEMVGLFINTIPVRMTSSSDDSFASMAQQLHKQSLDSGKYDFCPLGEIQTLSDVGTDTVKTLMIFENYFVKSKLEQLEDLFHIETDVYREQTNYPINFIINYTDVYSLGIMFDPAKYDAKEINELLERLQLMIERMIDAPEQQLDAISLVRDEEKALMLHQFNVTEMDYRKELTLVALFEEQTQRTPNATALIFKDKSISYNELNCQANRLARTLQKSNVEKNQVVGILVGRNMNMFISIMAVLKAGAAYLPIDPEYPADRMLHMLEDSGTKLLLTEKGSWEALDLNFEGKMIDMTEESRYDEDDSNLGTEITAKDLAYLIYTSGSTGKPKGVMLEQGSVHNFIEGMNRKISFDAGKSILNSTSIGFDIFVVESLLALIKGLRIIISDEEDQKDPALMRGLIEEHHIEMMQTTPSRLKLLISGLKDFSAFRSLKEIMVGGEEVPYHLAETLLREWDGRLLNMYGPTETTVWSTIKEIGRDEHVNIGKPIANTKIYILDQHLNLQPLGLKGELCIGGDGVARGYLNRQELTDERFIANPHAAGERIYRTGDLARWLPDGNIEYLGRMDEQVKIRGYRIELGEIESVLRKQAGIRDAAIIAKEDSSGDKYLCAYVVLAVGGAPFDAAKSREELRKELPVYMVPSDFVTLERLPVTRNGKLDRRALPEPVRSGMEGGAAPRNETEAKLVDVFQEVLGRDNVGVHDSFFDLGGHSLSVIRAVNLIESQIGVRLPLRAVFEHPTVEALSALLSAGEEAEYEPIPSALKKEHYPMSSAQKRLFVIHQMDSSSTVYNMPGMLEMTGELDLPRLNRVFEQLVARHESLRTSFHIVEGESVQRIYEQVNAAVEYSESEGQTEDALLNAFVRPFDVGSAPLIRLKVVKTDEARSVLLFDMHHLVSDGATIQIITKEFTQLYNGEKLEQPTVHYKDYSEWLRSNDLSRQKAYWLKQFSGELPVLDLPLDYPRPQVQRFHGTAFQQQLNAEMRERVQALGKKSGATEYMVLLSGLMVLLGKYSRQEDIIVGSPISGRNHHDTEQMIGMFVGTLAMRGKPEGSKAYQAFLSEVKEMSLRAFEHQAYPFEDIVEQVQVRRDLSRNPIFDVMFQLQNNEEEQLAVQGMALGDLDSNARTAKFDLTVNVSADASGYQVSWEYSSVLFKGETIARLAAHFERLMQTLTEAPEKKLADLAYITSEEEDQILVEYNRTKTNYPNRHTIQQLFEEQARATPDAEAVACTDTVLTYAELNRMASGIQGELSRQGVQAGQLVGIAAEKSVQMVAGILAILKSGCGYVPLNGTDPESRTRFVLEDCAINTILCGKENRTVLEQVRGNRSIIDLNAAYEPDEGTHVGEASDMAYVIYTSGTTGQPKGVVVEHRNVVRLVKNTTYATFEGARILQMGALSFDASTFEIWGALLNGGTLILPESDTVSSGEKLAAIIRSRGVNMVWMTAQLFNHVADNSPRAFEGLNHLLIGGEKLSSRHVEAIRAQHPTLQITNGYGPTENTTFSLTFEIDNSYANIPIGKPISNSTAYIRNGNQLCGIGVPGELYVGGDGVARGYLNRPELTSETFIANPYVEGERLYRTGDLARWLPDGNIEYLGRMDEQVKIRGYRIELGEIESALRKQLGIRDTAIIAKDDASGDKYICAYVVLEDGSEPFDAAHIRNKLRKELPAYMVPSYFVTLAQLPVTSNGKLDRRALPEPDRSGTRGRTAPRNETEAKLVEMFQEVLGLASVSIQDSFFELGGHSLRAMRLVNLIESQLGVRLLLRAVFENPTVEALSSVLLNADQEAAYEPIPQATKKDSYAMSSSQKRLFVIHQMDPSSIVYNMPGMLDMLGEVDLQRISRVFEQLIARHESLRTSFHLIEGEPSQRIHEQVNASVEFGESEGQTGDKLLAEFVRPFDVSEAPLIRMKVVKTGDGRNVLLFDMHHLISDGATIQIITKEFSQLYNGELLELPTVQYKDYSEWQRTRDLSKHQEYWLSQFGDDLPVLDLPLDYPRPHIQSFNGAALHQQMNVEVREQVQLLGRKTGATEYMVLLSSLMVLLSKYSRQEDIIVGSPVSGRTHHDTEQMVGMFVGTLALRGKPEGSKSYQDFLTEVKEMSLKAYEHQTYPFEDLVEQVQVRRDLSRNPIFDVMLVLQNNEEEQLDAQGMAFGDLETEASTAKFDLTLNVVADDSGYLVSWEYNRELFKADTIARMASHLEQLMQSLTEAPQKQLCELAMIREAEKQQLLVDFQAAPASYPAHLTIKDLFEEQVRKTPNRVAAVFENELLTYAELNDKANVVAARLLQEKQEGETIVGLLLGRNLNLLVGILGVVKAGCTYLPIDPDAPQDRIRYTLEDSQTDLLLTNAALPNWAPSGALGIPTLFIEELLEASDPADNPAVTIQPSDALYIIYTSGTTGNPKGTVIEHRNVVRLLVNDQIRFDFNEQDVWSLFHSYNFDFSVWEMYGALLYGGKVVVIPKAATKDSYAFLDILRKEQVTVVNQVPSAFYELMHAELAEAGERLQVRYLIFGGEALHVGKLKDWYAKYPQMKLINMYGITETTVHVTYKEIGAEEIARGISNIGQAIPTLNLYILNGEELCGIGMPGELCIAGAGVARGYLNRPELTSAKFVEHPHVPGERLYRSGDLARWLSDGNIEYLGRLDDQVKIRGYRIELKEIEEVLMKQVGVKDVAVIVRKDQAGDSYLSAYIVGTEPLEAADIDSIREGIRHELPDYMVPGGIMALEKLPITANGKLDRRQLPEPAFTERQAYVAPRDEKERTLANVFEEVLGIDQIGIDDHFFELGGDSIKAMRIMARLREVGYYITIVHVFNHPTIARLGQLVQYSEQAEGSSLADHEQSSNKAEPIVAQDENAIALSASNEDISWHMQQIAQRMAEFSSLLSAQRIVQVVPLSPIQNLSYDMGVRSSMAELHLNLRVDRDKFDRAVLQMLSRHPLLRTKINVHDNEMLELDCPDRLNIPFVDLTCVAKEIQNIIIGKARELYKSFDSDREYLGETPSQSMLLFRISEKAYIFLMPCSHLVFDGMSHESFCNQLLELYHGREESTAAADRYDYCDYLNQINKGPVHTSQNEIVEALELKKFQHAIATYQVLASKHSYEGFHFTYRFDKSMSHLLQNQQWVLPGRVYGELLKFVFPQTQIPILIVHTGRNYVGQHFYDYIGEFIDFVPYVIDTSEESPSMMQIDNKIEFLKNHNLNMSSMLTNKEFQGEYPEVAAAFADINPRQMNIPIYNFLAMYHHNQAASSEQQPSVHLESEPLAAMFEGTSTNVNMTGNELQISSFCLKGQGKALREHLNNRINDHLFME